MSPLFFETIQIREGLAQRLSYHQERITRTLGSPLLLLKDLFANLSLPFCETAQHKAKVVYDSQGIVLSTEITAYKKRAIRHMAVIKGNELDYSSKFLDRSSLEKLKAQAPEVDEIIICQNGFLTDTTYSNLAFGDGDHWVTPAHTLLHGTKRQFLLDNGCLSVAPLRPSDMHNFPLCSLINAMLDPGEVTLPTTHIYF